MPNNFALLPTIDVIVVCLFIRPCYFALLNQKNEFFKHLHGLCSVLQCWQVFNALNKTSLTVRDSQHKTNIFFSWNHFNFYCSRFFSVGNFESVVSKENNVFCTGNRFYYVGNPYLLSIVAGFSQPNSCELGVMNAVYAKYQRHTSKIKIPLCKRASIGSHRMIKRHAAGKNSIRGHYFVRYH